MTRFWRFTATLWLGLSIVGHAIVLPAPPAEVIPHAQDKPPGPPLSPAEAIGK